MTKISDTQGDNFIVDSHIHLWDLEKFEYSWMPRDAAVIRRNYLPQDIKRLMERNGVSKVVLVQAEESVEETEFLLDLAEANEFIGAVVGWVDLSDPNVGNQLESLALRPKLIGVRNLLTLHPDDAWLSRANSIRGLVELDKHDLSYDLLIQPRHLKYVPQLVEQIPGLRIVVNHIAIPPMASGEMEPWATDLATVASIPTVYCKISGLFAEFYYAPWKTDDIKPYVEYVVNQFGFDRVMWASDWPPCLMGASYDQALDVALECIGPISPEDKAKFLGGNATNFYRL